MSAQGNVIDDEDEGAASLLANAIDDGGDKPVSTDDVAALAAELAAAKADRKALLDTTATAVRDRDETRKALLTEQEQRFAAAETAITNGAAAAQAEVDRLTAEAAKAQEEGRWQDAAKFTRQAAVQEMKLDSFEGSKAQLAAERERLKTVAVDPKSRLSPRTRAWIEAHPRFETDRVYQGWATTAHEEAIAQRIQPDSDDYFAYVENAIAQNEARMTGKAAAPVQTNTQTPAERAAAEPVQVAPVAPRNGATVAAPVSRRTTVPANGSKPGVVKLTAEQRDTANRMFADRFDTEEKRLQHYATMMENVAAKGRLSSQGA